MNDKVDVQRELDQLAPNLGKFNKEKLNPSSVPEGYFNSLTDDVLRRAKTERQYKAPTPMVKKWSIRRAINNPMRLALAACFLLLLGGTYWAIFVMPKTNVDLFASIDQLGQEEIDEYIEENINDFDMSLMLEAEMINANAMGHIVTDAIPKEDMDAYLNELLEGIDLEELEEAL